MPSLSTKEDKLTADDKYLSYSGLSTTPGRFASTPETNKTSNEAFINVLIIFSKLLYLQYCIKNIVYKKELPYGKTSILISSDITTS